MAFFGLAETSPGSGVYAITDGAPTHAFVLSPSGLWEVAALSVAPMNVLYLNGTDVGTLGLAVVDAGAWMSGVRPTRASVALPEGFGHAESTVEAHGPRTDRIRLVTTDGLALANREALLDQVRDLVSDVVEARWSGSDRKLMVRLESDTVSAWTPSVAFALADMELSWDLVAYQGVRIDSTDRVVGFSTTPGVVQVGTHFGQGVMWISGSATTPTVTLKDFRGETKGSMTFVSLDADQALEVDLYTSQVFLHDAGVRTLSPESKTADVGGFFKFKPSHANVTAGAYPTLEVSSGTGLLLHRRGWRG